MDIEMWRVFVGLIVVVGLYGAAVSLLGAPASASGLLIIAVFGGIGVLAGRYLSERLT